MWCNQIFSLIHEGTIENIIVADNYEIANRIARANYGNSAIAVDTTYYPVNIGDHYIDGHFYRDEEEILPNPTEHEDIQRLISENEDIMIAQADMLIDISVLQLGL